MVRFDDTMETLFDTAVDASSDNLAIAKHFVSRLDAQGGTEMLPALKAALQDATPEDATRLRQVVFLTDGSVGNEAQLFQEIADRRGRSRLFTVGIGSAPNSYFMTRAAELGRGTFTHIGSDAQVLERMSALFAKLEKPVMMGLKAEWPAGASVEAWPDPLPDLYAGEPVVLSAKIPSRQGRAHARQASFDGKPWTATLKLEDAVQGAGVAKLWARSKIASLEAKAYTRRESRRDRQGNRDGRARASSGVEPDEPDRHRQDQVAARRPKRVERRHARQSPRRLGVRQGLWAGRATRSTR